MFDVERVGSSCGLVSVVRSRDVALGHPNVALIVCDMENE